MCYTRLAGNVRCKNSPKFAIYRPLHNFVELYLRTRACIDNRKNVVKQQYLLHKSSQYGELQPTSGCDRLVSLGHPAKFQRVSRLGFVTAPTLLNARQPNFARGSAISCTGTLYTPCFIKKLDPLLLHYIFALAATNCVKISRST